MNFFVHYFLISSFLFGSLDDLNTRVDWELEHMSYPADWVKEEENCLQVAIIGAGMAGIAAAHALFRVGIHQLTLFDESEKGEEGPWITYAQMQVLRTSKEATGPSLLIPSLTFQAWYEAVFGIEKWNTLLKATPKEWSDYLFWLRTVLKLPVENNCRLTELVPLPHCFELKFVQNGKCCSAFAKKVILATGRKGFGGTEIPSYMEKIPKKFYAHTSELYDYQRFKGKKLAIVGCGTQAFDAAGTALEAGACSVSMIFRKKEIPSQDKFASLSHVGMEQGFHKLSDDWRYKIMDYVHKCGVPPPPEALKRIKFFENLHFHPESQISIISYNKNGLEITTNKESLSCDFMILATGYHIAADSTVELKNLSEHICLWKDCLVDASLNLGQFPYLGPHFQFLEKHPGSAPFLKHIYCFNYGALLSHGLTSSSIDSLSVGAERVARGIAADFFVEEIDTFFNDL